MTSYLCRRPNTNKWGQSTKPRRPAWVWISTRGRIKSPEGLWRIHEHTHLEATCRQELTPSQSKELAGRGCGPTGTPDTDQPGVSHPKSALSGSCSEQNQIWVDDDRVKGRKQVQGAERDRIRTSQNTSHQFLTLNSRNKPLRS